MPAQCHKRSPRQITSIGSHCGRTLWAIPLRAHGILQAGRSRPRYEPGATGIGKLENGSRPEAISEIARLRRSLPEPDPENRAAISIRSARPPIITVIGGRDKLSGYKTGARAAGCSVISTCSAPWIFRPLERHFVADFSSSILSLVGYPSGGRGSRPLPPPLPLLRCLTINDGPRVRQLRQPSQMLEVLDCGSGSVVRKTWDIEATRAVDFPEGTPKDFWS